MSNDGSARLQIKDRSERKENFDVPGRVTLLEEELTLTEKAVSATLKAVEHHSDKMTSRFDAQRKEMFRVFGSLMVIIFGALIALIIAVLQQGNP